MHDFLAIVHHRVLQEAAQRGHAILLTLARPLTEPPEAPLERKRKSEVNGFFLKTHKMSLAA